MGRLGPSRRGRRGGPHQRVRRPVPPGGNCMIDWWTIPDLADVGFPIVEAEAGRHVRGDQARGHRRPGHRAHRHRADPLRDGRPHELHHPRRGGRLHHHPLEDDGPRPGAREGVRGGPPPEISRSPSPTRTAGRRSARSRTPGRTPPPRRGRPTASCASGSTAWGSASTPFRTELVGWSSTHGRWRASRPRTFPRCSSAWASAADRARGGALHARDRAARADRPAVGDRLRRGRPRVQEIVAYWPALIARRRRAARPGGGGGDV
jgi:hypothetical protein